MATKTTKRALILGVISLFVCFTMLIGTTYAWFTDSVTSSGNVIKTGTLEVTLKYSAKPPVAVDGKIEDAAEWQDASQDAIFEYGNWEPGYTQVRYVKVENEGTLDLKFMLNIVPNAKAEGVDLADVIDVYIANEIVASVKRNLEGLTYVGTLADLIADPDGAAYGVLYADDADKAGKTFEAYTIVLKMQETAGNEYQGKSVGGGFIVQLLATQLASEKDDIGADYDENATYPIVAKKNVTDNTVDNVLETSDGSKLTIPAGAPLGTYDFVISNKNITDNGDGTSTLSMNMNLKLNGVDVEYDGNTVYTVETYVGEGKRIIDVTHNGESILFTADAGTATYYVGSFSPFTIVYDEFRTVTGLSGSGTEEDPYLINDYYDLCWFRDDVNTYTSDRSNQYVGKYVKLTADINLAGEQWEPIGSNSVGDHMSFMGTFDGDGHTISNLYIYAESGNLGFFAYTGSYAEWESATVKNINFVNIDVSTEVTDHWTAGHGDYVGGVIANAGGNTVVENVNVSGDIYISGCAYVGGIVGHGYPRVNNCSVTANDGSYILSGYWCAGGIVGYFGEGATIANSSVAGLGEDGLRIWGCYGAAAAICGYAGDGVNGDNLYASNVEISGADYCLGYIFGASGTLTNSSFDNVRLPDGVSISDAEMLNK